MTTRHTFIASPSGHPLTRNSYLNTREAERAAARLLGKDWRQRGYRIGHGPLPEDQEEKRGAAHPIKGNYGGLGWGALLWRGATANQITWDPFTEGPR